MTTGRLTIPDVKPDEGLINAAIAYATAGWYVLPIEPGEKRPAAMLGPRWQAQSTRDVETIVAWFAGTDHQLGLHAGRSGALIFDVDYFDRLHPLLRRAFDECDPPTHLTRASGERGHRVFLQPEGRVLGNSRGALGRDWGEVRGINGLIVVAPSVHPDGGMYHWRTTGPVPPVPSYVADVLPDAGKEVSAATDAAVREFLDTMVESNRPALMSAVLAKYASAMESGSRHEATVSHLCWAMREAALGFYPADVAASTMESMFRNALAGERRNPTSEFAGALAFAVAQVSTIDIDERRREASERLRLTDRAPVARPASEAPTPDGAATTDPLRDPSEYFADRSAGIDIEMLAKDVVSMGPLSVGPGGNLWSYEGGVWVRRKGLVRARAVAALRGRYRNAHADNVEAFVKASVPTIDVAPTPDHLNMRNGMLDWRTRELLPHDPTLGSVVQFPVDWEPDATCPMFDDFLSSVLSDDYIELAWQMIAYLMYGGNPKQRAFLMLGSGGNGKGTLIRVITAILGERNISTESLDDLSTNRFAAFSLHGKIANIAGDIDATYQATTAQFKKLTGEDCLSGEQKYGDRFTFVNWAVPVFSANKMFGSSDVSDGYLRRWVVMRFDRTFTGRDRIDGLSDRLAAEAAGIVARAVGFLPGLIGGDFASGGEIAEAADEFAANIDHVRLWMRERVVMSPGGKMRRSDVYAGYRQWAAENGYHTMAAAEVLARITSAIKSPRAVRKIHGTYYVCGIEPVREAIEIVGEE
jgi:P4 family phage/plasmid primase-like protien